MSAEDIWKKRVHRCGWCDHQGLPRKPRLWVLTVHASWVSVCLPVWSVYLYLAAWSCATLCNRLDCSPPGYAGHGIFQARILNFSGKNFLLQGIFLTQGSNPRLLCLLHCECTLRPLGHQRSPCLCTWPRDHVCGHVWTGPWIVSFPHHNQVPPSRSCCGSESAVILR